MDPHELKPDDYGKYRAYYLGQLVDLINFDPASTSVTVPTSPGRFEAVSWSDLDKFDPPHVEILRFEVNPAVGYFDSTFEAVWENEDRTPALKLEAGIKLVVATENAEAFDVTAEAGPYQPVSS